MILIKNADVYAPEHLGIKDVLICGAQIEAVGEGLEGGSGCRIIDAEGKKLTPGLIDRHVHVTGGGGEGSFHTRTPQIQLSSVIRAGITTLVGLLGTDDVSRTPEDLIAKVKALKEEGISAYALCGAYGVPSPAITGSIKKDIAFIDEILGLKLAVSDHRAPNISTEELIRLASDVRTAGMISGKCGCVVLHMGDGKKMLSQVFEALEETEIPVKTFQPTHVNRNHELFLDSLKLAKLGGTIDLTCEDFPHGLIEGGKDPVIGLLEEARRAGVPMERMTLSSDGQGSWSNYDEAGNLTQMGVSSVDTMYRQVVYEVQNENMSLEEALSLGTRNVAKALEVYPKKGAVHEGSDADVLVLNGDLSMNTVIARGSLMMQDGVLLKKGTYEA